MEAHDALAQGIQMWHPPLCPCRTGKLLWKNTPLHLAHSQARCSITYVFMKGYRELMEWRVPFHFEGLEFLANCKAGFRCWHPVERTIRRSG